MSLKYGCWVLRIEMTFSQTIKKELTDGMPNARHCRLSELAAIICLAGEMRSGRIVLQSENEAVIDRMTELVHKLFSEESVQKSVDRGIAGKEVFTVDTGEASAKLIEALKLDSGLIPGAVIFQQPCCKRAFLRGAFLTSGSVSDPQKDYHFEIVTSDGVRAGILTDIMAAFNIEAKNIVRKNTFVVYLKDGENIVDVLNIMEAHVALMELENIRILKSMRNSVNRRVNCEAANIDKTIRAAGRQIDDIRYLRDKLGFDKLSEELRVTAKLRLENPECSLSELGQLHERPVGRSGVYHRLQKLSDMAERLRGGQPIQ